MPKPPIDPASKPPPQIDDPCRTDMDCTSCGRSFIAEFDLSINGNHVVLCPWCEHEHCRVITDGAVTGDRWDTRMQRIDVRKICVWKSSEAPAQTSIASAWLRERWMSRYDVDLGRLT